LVVLDIGMPSLDGTQALPLIRSASPATRILLFSGDVSQATTDDADAVLEKGLAPHRLVNVLLDLVARPEPKLELSR
jgi:DNA-binding NarL/FixJ family response regulator